MTFKRTQVYLDPEEHRMLAEEAARRGTSLTGLLREIVAAWARRGVPPSNGFGSLIGLIQEGEQTDIARLEDAYKKEARDASLAREMARPAD